MAQIKKQQIEKQLIFDILVFKTEDKLLFQPGKFQIDHWTSQVFE